MNRKTIITIATIALGIGVTLAGWFIGNGISTIKSNERFVTVKGLAERQVEADRAVWAITYIAASNMLGEAKAKLEAEQNAVQAFLEQYKIKTADTELQRFRVIDQLARTYSNERVANRYLLQQTTLVRTDNIKAVASAAQNIGDLIDAGVIFGTLDGYDHNAGPHYLFTKLNDIKPRMIALATQNARAAADQFVENSGTTISGIRRARQGQFQILPAENAPNLREETQIHKKVRLVTTLQYVISH